MKRSTRLVLGTVSMLFAGIIYAWSILKAPLADSFGWSVSDLSVNFTLTMCFFCIGGIVSGFLIKKTGPKLLIVISGILAGSGFILTSSNNGNLLMLYISYGIISGLGIGIAYNAILSCVNSWFPDKKGLCSGCLMMGFGASTLVLGNLANAMFSSSIGWKTTYLIFGIVIMVFIAVPGFFASLPAETDKAGAGENDNNSLNFKPKQVLKSLTFWKFYFFSISMAAVGNVVISLTKDIALSIGASAVLATSLVGALSICNGLGRLLSGSLFDRIGRKRTMLAGNIITILAPCILLMSLHWNTVALGTVGLCLCGLSYGFSPSISSAVTLSFFGQKHFSLNFALINTMLIPTSTIATVVGSIVTKSGSFAGAICLLIGLAIFSLFLSLSIKDPV